MSKTLVDILAEAAEKDPNGIAFRCLEDRLSYAELQKKSQKLAATLRGKGVRRGDRVGIFMRKSIQSPVAIFGILASGAAYVPLDPNAPSDRLVTLIGQCGIKHLVSDQAMVKGLKGILDHPTAISSIIGANQIDNKEVDCVTWEEVGRAITARQLPLSQDDIAYIMFTSGSTGVPKGIVHTHSSALSYVRAAIDLFDVNADDNMANHSALHFDISTFAMFGGPLAGAPVTVIPDAYTRLPAELSKLMERDRISIWYSVPFALIQLLENGALDQRNLENLRWVVFAGEPLPPKHLKALMEQWPQARFSNNYGPAEVNVCTFHHFDSLSDVPESALPIGRPWEIAESLILDNEDATVPPGVVGELMIRAPTRMREYWQAPELTEASLYRRPNPAGGDDVFYRTGDLVFEDEFGVLHFSGRMDRQIKMRGFRVELDEIELVLCGHPSVVEAAAACSKNGKKIVAAVTLRCGEKPSQQELVRHLKAKLPAYSVPEHVHICRQFPRTVTEKIDRTALFERIEG
ncbi:MAG: amino acid adenylation domain-containing protein [Marinosulfonomonas sp.]